MQKTDFNKTKKIHFIGIGGIGLSAIAKLMLAQGKTVSGSDMNDSEILEDLRRNGAKIFIGQKAENLADDTELVIYTLAIPKDNLERASAEKMELPMLSYPEALGILFNDKYGIAICGTHGKSTTTSMVSLVLAGGGLDPNVVVGSKVPEYGGNLRVGKSEYFVIEACEYERAFLNYYPKIIILNNTELDHTDYYKNIEDYRSAFLEFVGNLPEDGVLILNGDDKEVESVKISARGGSASGGKVISFGFGKKNDVQGYDFKTEDGKTKFKVKYCGKNLGEFALRVPGKFNVYNALAAIATGLHLGINAEEIKKSLAEFGGIWRRFEIKGEYKPAVASVKLWRGKGATIISDYAHHPTAVQATIEAAREFYPGRRIVAVFQPHQHNRTMMLYQDFLKSFDSADALILVEIFDVAGREEKKDQNVSSEGLVGDIKARIKNKIHPNPPLQKEGNVEFSPFEKGPLRQSECEARGLRGISVLYSDSIFYAANLAETRKLIDEKIQEGDIVLIMGAGDIYKVADELTDIKK